MNKLVDEYNNTYHRSIGKIPIDADYSALTKEIESIHKAPKFKIGDRNKITKLLNTIIFLPKTTTPIIGRKKYS